MDNESRTKYDDELDAVEEAARQTEQCPNGLCESTNIEKGDNGVWDCGDCGLFFATPLFRGVHPAIVVLNALLAGQSVTIGKITYELGYDEKFGFPIVGLRMSSSKHNDREFIYGVEYGLNEFLQDCLSLSREDVFTIAANTGLNKVNRRIPVWRT